MPWKTRQERGNTLRVSRDAVKNTAGKRKGKCRKSGTAVDQENLRAITENVASVTGDGAFTLKDSGKVQVLKVKKDDVITIGETVVAGYVTSIQDDLEDGEAVTTKVDVSGSNATITMGGQDVTLTFTNTRNVVPPTGLEDSHTTPYGLMVALAVLSGAVFAGGMVARRRRRLE